MDFEIPFRELGFSGVPHRSTAFIMPTVCTSACQADQRSPSRPALLRRANVIQSVSLCKSVCGRHHPKHCNRCLL